MFATVGLGIAATPLIAACAPKAEQEGEQQVETKDKAGAPVTEAPEIRFMTRTGPLGEFMKKFGALHQEKSEGTVRIKIEEGDGTDVGQKLLTAAAAGTAPDVFWQYYMLTPFNMYSGVMLPVNDYAAEIDSSIWFPWALDLLSMDGKMYGLPLGVMTGYNTIIYNKDILAQAGMPEPDGPNNTWADLIEIAKGVKENTGLWGLDTAHWWWATETVVRNFGSNIVKFMGDESFFLDEKTQVAMKMVYDLGNTEKVMPTAASIEGDRGKMFAGGKLAMMSNCAADVVCGMDAVIGGRFPYGYTTLPTKDNGLMGTQQQADSLHIYAKSEHPELCFPLMAEIAGVDASIWTSVETGMTPGACPAAWVHPDVCAKYPWYCKEGEWFKTNTPEPPPMPGNFRYQEFRAAFEAEWYPIKNGERAYNTAELEKINKVFQDILGMDKP